MWLRLDRLAAAPAPALAHPSDGTYVINDHGKKLLEGKVDWIHSQGGIDLWLGGVHLQATRVCDDGMAKARR